METFKFALFSIVVLALLGFGGYWAVSTIQTGSEYASVEKLAKLENENGELKKEVVNLKDQVGLMELQMKNEQASVAAPTAPKATSPAPNPTLTPPVVSTGSTSVSNQALIDDLEKLIADKVLMRLKSRGTRVGTIQEFFNVYNNKTAVIDNDFGEGTKRDVMAFQKAEGLSSDGEAGATTFQKMIDRLQAKIN